jgi:hypothetical protein
MLFGFGVRCGGSDGSRGRSRVGGHANARVEKVVSVAVVKGRKSALFDASETKGKNQAAANAGCHVCKAMDGVSRVDETAPAVSRLALYPRVRCCDGDDMGAAWVEVEKGRRPLGSRR